MYSQLSFGDHQSNIMTEKADQLLSRGIPLIKKKIVNNSFRPDEVSYLEHVNFDFSVDYRKLLYNYADKHLLDYLLMNFTTKVYQIYYDVEQIKYLSPDTLPHYNSKLSVYFENDLIRDFYDAGKIDSDYFGILSWRFQEKNGVQFKSTFVDAKHDIYAFANSAYRQDVFEDSVKCHPYFMDIFNIVLKNLKIDSNVRPQIGLYQNTVIARGDIYRKYVSEYLIPTMDLLNRFPDRFVDLNQKLWADAKYKYDPALTQRLFEHTGKPYYTYHTFICERLWSIFYEVNKDKYDLKILNRLDFMDAPVPRARQLTPISPQLPVVPGFRGSSVEAPIEKPKPAEPDYKDCAICISHQQSTHTLEKVNNENRVYDLFLASNESVNISKWQNSFKKHKIVSSKSVDAVQSRVDRVTLQSIFLCSAVMQLWMEEEQISKHRYKVVVFANNLNVLSNLIDVNRSKTQADTIYA